MTTMGEFIAARMKEAHRTANDLSTACRLPGKMPDFFACGGPLAEQYWQAFTPATVGSMLDALKFIMDTHRNQGCGYYCLGCIAAFSVRLDDCPERRAVAAIWRHHPDYKPAWKND